MHQVTRTPFTHDGVHARRPRAEGECRHLGSVTPQLDQHVVARLGRTRRVRTGGVHVSATASHTLTALTRLPSVMAASAVRGYHTPHLCSVHDDHDAHSHGKQCATPVVRHRTNRQPTTQVGDDVAWYFCERSVRRRVASRSAVVCQRWRRRPQTHNPEQSTGGHAPDSPSRRAALTGHLTISSRHADARCQAPATQPQARAVTSASCRASSMHCGGVSATGQG